MKILLLILFLIFLMFFFIIINKRLVRLNEKHMKHIWSRVLIKDYFSIIRTISFLLILLSILSSLVILTLL